MARRLTTNSQIDSFIQKILDEAQHHAPGVTQVVMPLSQALRARLNLAQDRVEVYERLGQMARTCWVTISGRRYAFSYNYNDEKIDLRDRSVQGPVRHQFDNQTSLSTIQNVIANL